MQRYICCFFKKKNGIRIASLRSIIGLFNVRVRWEYYSPRKHSPTQCSRCQYFGHGSANCNRPFRCVCCDENHDSKECPRRGPPDPSTVGSKPRVPDNQISCANCKGNHTASYHGCKIRTEYQERMLRVRQRSAQHQTRATFNLEADFPAPPVPRNVSFLRQHFPQPQQQPLSQPQQVPQHAPMDMKFIHDIIQAQQKTMFEMMTSLVEQMMTKMEQMLTNMFAKLNHGSVQK